MLLGEQTLRRQCRSRPRDARGERHLGRSPASLLGSQGRGSIVLPGRRVRQLPRAQRPRTFRLAVQVSPGPGEGAGGRGACTREPWGATTSWVCLSLTGRVQEEGETTGILIQGSKSHCGGRMEDWNHAALLRELRSAFRFYRPLCLFPGPGNPATSKERTVLATDRVLISLERPLFSSQFPAMDCEKLQSSRWTRDFDFSYLYITMATKLQNTLDIHWGF